MKKIAVVYWSGTGNTEAMANSVVEGAKSAGCDVTLFTASEFSKDKVNEFEGFAFGCPSMGAEVLEESEFQPMWDDVKSKVQGKSVVLFGSYDWGDGEWMRNWEEEVSALESYICNNTPETSDEEACKALGAKLA